MRRRTREAEILAGIAVALLVAAAAPVVYVGIVEGAAAVRSGLHARALQMGAAALLAVVVAVVALAAYSHWLDVTERPRLRKPHPAPSPRRVSVTAALVVALGVASWPLLFHAYRRAGSAFAEDRLATALGYLIGAVALLWFVLWIAARFVAWVRRSIG